MKCTHEPLNTIHKTDTNRFTHEVLAAFAALRSSSELKADIWYGMPTA